MRTALGLWWYDVRLPLFAVVEKLVSDLVYLGLAKRAGGLLFQPGYEAQIIEMPVTARLRLAGFGEIRKADDAAVIVGDGLG